ncbi:MAG TPA: hypothetical protein VGC92_08380 [Phenylobacterium sp.]|jgi:hypothetical protein
MIGRAAGLVVLGALAAGLAPRAARAADEEIQVYMDEIGPPHRLGLDVHLNHVATGRTVADYPGQEASEGRTRITPEWSWALNPQLELGVYLPLAEVTRGGELEAGGAKARVKWVAPRAAGQDSFWGLNFEIGRVRHALDVNPWNAELKGIAGIRKGPWTLAANLNVDWVVSGPDQGAAPNLQLALKAAYSVGRDTAIGLETYNGLGTIRTFGRLGRNDHQTYLVVDKGFRRWDVNFGVGYGYGAPEDRWIVKAVIGVPIGPGA